MKKIKIANFHYNFFITKCYESMALLCVKLIEFSPYPIRWKSSPSFQPAFYLPVKMPEKNRFTFSNFMVIVSIFTVSDSSVSSVGDICY